jgi:hypothetical protein
MNNRRLSRRKLENHGITDDEILNVYEILNRATFESAATIRR